MKVVGPYKWAPFHLITIGEKHQKEKKLTHTKALPTSNNLHHCRRNSKSITPKLYLKNKEKGKKKEREKILFGNVPREDLDPDSTIGIVSKAGRKRENSQPCHGWLVPLPILSV